MQYFIITEYIILKQKLVFSSKT